MEALHSNLDYIIASIGGMFFVVFILLMAMFLIIFTLTVLLFIKNSSTNKKMEKLAKILDSELKGE